MVGLGRPVCYQFGDWTVETQLNLIRRDDSEVHLEPKSMAVLDLLLRRHGEVVAADQLLDEVWPGQVVGTNALHRHIALLRNALNDSRLAPTYIETVTKRGYRAIAPVRVDMANGRDGLETKEVHSHAADAWRIRIAVAPFRDGLVEPGVGDFASDVVEAVVVGLTNFSDFSVIPPSALPITGITAEDKVEASFGLGAHFLLEGSVAHAGREIRITVRLTDVRGREVVWSKTFSYALEAGKAFEIHDDVKARVAAGVADSFGVISARAYARARVKPATAVAPDEAVMLAKAHEGDARRHLEARSALERVTANHPEFANAWAWLGAMYRDEYVFWINELPDPLVRAEQMARRALALDSTNQEALLVLTDVRFYQRDFAAFRETAQHAVELHPNSPDLLSVVASHLAHAGYYSEAESFAQRAVDLTPEPTLHMLGTLALCHFGLADYPAAERVVRRVWASVDRSHITGMQGYYLALMVASLARLGRVDEARACLASILESIPAYGRILGPSWYRQGASEELRSQLEADLAIAGLIVEPPAGKRRLSAAGDQR